MSAAAAAPVLHYRGDRTNLHPEQVYGPDMFGGLWRATSAVYDLAQDRTTIAFAPIPRPTVRTR